MLALLEKRKLACPITAKETILNDQDTRLQRIHTEEGESHIRGRKDICLQCLLGLCPRGSTHQHNPITWAGLSLGNTSSSIQKLRRTDVAVGIFRLTYTFHFACACFIKYPLQGVLPISDHVNPTTANAFSVSTNRIIYTIWCGFKHTNVTDKESSIFLLLSSYC